MTDPADALSEATRLSILQGRFEALHQQALEIEPRHLLLGLLKTMDPARLTQLGLDSSACATLIAQLGSTPTPAPLSSKDIEYAESCFAMIARAIQGADGLPVEPAALLMALRSREMTDGGDDQMTDDR